jgi:hypothetical protein
MAGGTAAAPDSGRLPVRRCSSALARLLEQPTAHDQSSMSERSNVYHTAPTHCVSGLSDTSISIWRWSGNATQGSLALGPHLSWVTTLESASSRTVLPYPRCSSSGVEGCSPSGE